MCVLQPNELYSYYFILTLYHYTLYRCVLQPHELYYFRSKTLTETAVGRIDLSGATVHYK